VTDPSSADRRRALERLRRQKLADSAALAVSLADVREARADGTADDEHDPEGSTLTSDWSRLQGLDDASRRSLADIDAALLRLDAGTYGICVGCARPVAPGRLDARPATALCIDCARAR
jgi:RNA polymerase-binding transcription factor DksA